MTGLLLSLVGLWILLTAVWVAVWPLFAGAGSPRSELDVERQELEAEKARLLQEIHELELDYETGKLSDDDYRAIEARLKGRAVEVMQRIDALSPSTKPPSPDSAASAPEERVPLGAADVSRRR